MKILEPVSLETIEALERQLEKLERQRGMREPDSIFFPKPPRKQVVHRTPQPAEPDVALCKRCGEMLWKVTGPNGNLLLIDRYQIETLPGLDGTIVREPLPGRSPAIQRLVQDIGGYQLLEPRWFGGWDNEAPGWQWSVNVMSLVDAEVLQQPIYSSHKLTCEQATDQAIIASATNVALEGDAAGDREGKRGSPQKCLRFPKEFLKRRCQVIRERPRRRRSRQLLSAELAASLAVSPHSPAKAPRPQAEAGNRQLTLWS